MAGKIRPWQISETKDWAGLTKENHLIEYLKKNDPIKLDSTITKLIGYRTGADNVLSFIDRWATKTYDVNAKLTWDCVKGPRTIVRCVGAKDKSFGNNVTTGNLGVGGEPFYIGMEKDWFFKGETLYGPHGNNYPLRVISDQARMIGSTAWYKVVPFGAKVVNTGIPASECQMGCKYSYGAYFVGDTLSRQGGGVRHNTSFSMENEWSVIRMSNEVAGGSENWVLKVALPEYQEDGKIKLVTKWIEKELFETHTQFNRNKRYAKWYGVSTKNDDGTYSNYDFSGEAIKAGDGLYDQMKYNGVEYFNMFDGEDILRRILNWAKQICAGGKVDIKDRVFTIRAGQWGIEMLSNFMANVVNGWTRFEISAKDLGIIKQITSPLMPNGGAALSAGYMFTEWHSPMGYRFRLEVDDWKDNEMFYKEQINGVPMSSYMFHVSYDGDTNDLEKGANIQNCAVKDGPGGTTNDYVSYQSGIRQDFNNGANNPYMSFDIDKSVIHLMSPHFGCIVKDPTAVKIFAPSTMEGF